MCHPIRFVIEAFFLVTFCHIAFIVNLANDRQTCFCTGVGGITLYDFQIF
jgi:hypothetical protein